MVHSGCFVVQLCITSDDHEIKFFNIQNLEFEQANGQSQSLTLERFGYFGLSYFAVSFVVITIVINGDSCNNN